MSKYKYSAMGNENSAKAVGRYLPISTKKATQICDFIRSKKLEFAKRLLQEVIKKERAVPFTRFNWNAGHRKGMAAGKYPVKACSQILKILKSAESNAQGKGLNSSNLVIIHINAQKGPRVQRYKRIGSMNSKNTHLEVIVEEKK